MGEWEQLHWSGRPQPKPVLQRRLKPNGFARLARTSARKANALIIAALFLAALASSVAAVLLHFKPGEPTRLVLDARTRDAQQLLERHFPGIESTFVAQVELDDMAAARGRADALAARLAERADLFTSVFVPGTGAFYRKYANLFRDAAQVERAVARALRMQPLYHALASAPELPGFAALVSEIGRAVSQGRSPPGLSGLLLAAAAAVEGEIEGVARPIDWTELAGLSTAMEGQRWFIVATPRPEKMREAASFASTVSAPDSGIQWFFPPAVRAARQDAPGELLLPLGFGLIIVLIIFWIGLGSLRFAAIVLLLSIVTVGLTAGLAPIIAPELDAVGWSFVPVALAPAMLFGLMMILVHLQARQRGSAPLTATMLAAQRQGTLLVALAVLTEIFWCTWFFRELTSLTETAVIGAVAGALALILALTLLPAALCVLDRGEVRGHWLDRLVARPLGPNLRNGRQILVLVVIAASVFCGVFVPGVRFSDAPRQPRPAVALDTPAARDAVHFVVPAGERARRVVEQITALPQTGAIRWVEQFLPADADQKLQHLRLLDGYLAGVPVTQASAYATPGTTFAALEAGLRQISGDPATAPDLREASHRLRRAFSVYTNPEMPTPERIDELETALFSGLASLPAVARQLAGLDEPTIDEVDVALRQRFVSKDGLWRIEVLPKQGVRTLAFAGAMRKFSPQAAGGPIVALARSEIMHHEAALALAFALVAAAIAALVYLQDVSEWVIVLVPAAFSISLSAAAAAASGQVVLPSALAAIMMGIVLCISMSIMLVMWCRDRAASPWARAAVLPPLAFMGVGAPLMMSGSAAVAAFGQATVVFLGIAIAVNLLVVPQACAWTETLRGR